MTTDTTQWELVPGGSEYRTLKAAGSTANWLNHQRGGRGRYIYRARTQPNGAHRVERSPNPDVDPALFHRRPR